MTIREERMRRGSALSAALLALALMPAQPGASLAQELEDGIFTCTISSFTLGDIAIAFTAWPPYARVARAETMLIRNADYISAMRLQGASQLRIVLKHVVPMCVPSLIVRTTYDMAGIIIIAAGLGFLGLGAQPPIPEWGAMISTGREPGAEEDELGSRHRHGATFVQRKLDQIRGFRARYRV